jgi:hypothetical protein
MEVAGSDFSTRGLSLKGEKIGMVKFISINVKITWEVTTINNYTETSYCIQLNFHPDVNLVDIKSV